MKKIRKNVLLTFAICLTASSCASCKKFSWEARPYSADHKTEKLHPADPEADEVACYEEKFSEFTCFDAENIAELKTAIDQIKSKKLKKEIKKRLKLN